MNTKSNQLWKMMKNFKKKIKKIKKKIKKMLEIGLIRQINRKKKEVRC